MLLESDFIDEVQVGCQDVLGRLVAQGSDEQCDDAFGDDGVAVGLEVELAILKGGAQPNA